MTLWHGRFGAGPADELLAFTASLQFDQRLAADDIAGSRAHVRGLVRAGLVDGDEAAAILSALDAVSSELTAGTFVICTQPVDFGTGAIYRRIATRRVVPNDFEWFTMTVAATGPHIGVWVDEQPTLAAGLHPLC